MKRIFITGGSGFIGTKLCSLLKELGHNVRSFDIQDTLLNDVRDYTSLKNAILEYKPTHVIHLGMISKVKEADKSFTYAKESIFGGTMNVLEVLTKEYTDVERLVFASSSTVYGDFIKDLCPPNEDHPTAPVSIYGALKLCSETLVKSYYSMYGLEYTIIRPSSVYGPFDMNMRVIGKFLYDAMTKGSIKVYGDSVSMDFSYIDDVANGIIRATFSNEARNETFNITRGQTRGLLEAAELVQHYIPGCKIEILDRDGLFSVRGAFDVSKAEDLLGYKPKINLPQGIKMYYDHMLAHLSEYKK